MAQKRDFMYKVNANGFFSPYSKRYGYFHFYWIKSVDFSIIMLEKSSVINFAKKNNKNKRSKNKEIHKKFIKQ